ncbi:MAG: hypothetical protein IJT68_01815 [Lentisphaeria bacterium]|nr:hypothetical protein [Lentisphaeria bacterium]
MPTVDNAVSGFARKHTFACIFLSLLTLFLLGAAGLECVKIDVRFFFMTGDMTDYPVTPFPTVFGEPYYDYPSTMFILSWLATFCGRVMARWTVTLPSMICGAYSIAMTWRIGEKAEKGLGLRALMISLVSFEYFNAILGFGIDLPVCAAGVTMAALLQEDRLNIFLSTLAFAALLAFCFAVRGPMGPVLLGAGTAGWLAMSRRWKQFFVFGAAGAAVLAGCVGFAWWLLHRIGGDGMWAQFYEWQFGNRMDGGSALFYLLGSLPTYAPLSIPFLYTLVAGKRALLKAPVGPWLGFLFAVEILLTIPGCQHTRYMTLAVPFMALSGAWGMLHARLDLKLPEVWRERIVRLARLVLLLFPYAAMLGIAICMAVSFFFVSAAWIPYCHYLGGILLVAAAVHCFRGHDSWTARFSLACCSMAVFLVLGIIPAISAREDSRPFIQAVEQASGNDRVFFFNVNADHDGIKYLAEVNNARRRQVFFICDDDQMTEEQYAYRTVDEGFGMLKDEIVIVRQGKRHIETLAKCAEAARRSVVPQFEGKLGHKKYLAVRLVPAPDTEAAGNGDADQSSAGDPATP